MLRFEVHTNFDTRVRAVDLRHMRRYFWKDEDRRGNYYSHVKDALEKFFPGFGIQFVNLMTESWHPSFPLGATPIGLRAWRASLLSHVPGSDPGSDSGLVAILPTLSLLASFEDLDQHGDPRHGELYAVPGALEAGGVIFHLTCPLSEILNNLGGIFLPRHIDDPGLRTVLTDDVRVRLDQLLEQGLA